MLERVAAVGRLRRDEVEESYGVALHTVVRTCILEWGFERAHSTLAVRFFPLYESARRRRARRPPRDALTRLARHLTRLDEEESVTASCLSVALTVQALLFSVGTASDLVIGVAKRDEKLTAHAWIRLPNGDIVSAGRAPRESMRVMRVASMLARVDGWVANACVSG